MSGRGLIEIKTEKMEAGTISKPGHPVHEKTYIRITVADTGCGISDNNLPKIFDPFFTTKEVGKGTGLGLAIIYSIIKGHNGWIDVCSKEEQGTTIEIYLPVPEKTQPPIEMSQAVQSEAADLEHSFPGNKTILVVEDDEDLLTLTAEILENIGYRVLTAADGQEALDIYANTGQDIDLVFSDMIMPKQSGTELFTKLHRQNPAIKFILVSGYSLDELQDRMYNDMSALLMKPYTPKQIADIVSEVLNN
jgi:CheY-like chemotaxis protein